MVVPEMQRREDRDTAPEGRPYPSFSKAHSREAVHSLEDVRGRDDPVTPDSTDLGKSKPTNTTPVPSKPATTNDLRPGAQAPPSPPLTAKEPELRKAASGSSMKRTTSETKGDGLRRKSADHLDDVYPKMGFSASRSSLRDAEEGKTRSPKSNAPTRPSSTSTKTSFLGSMFKDKGGLASGKKTPLSVSPVKPPSRRRTSGKGSITDSDATSVPDRRHSRRPPTLVSGNDVDSPPSNGSRPHTPDPRDTPQPLPDRKHTPTIEVFTSDDPERDFDVDTEPLPTSTTAPPPPPPPPPLNMAPTEIPRVDYLLQNGGLPDIVTREFTSAANPTPPQSFQQYMSPQLNSPKHIDVKSIFRPYHQLLDNYSNVLAKHGSVAVATGYKSVARRLLDRLEHVFARNISSEKCMCVMCKSLHAAPSQDDDLDNGVSWGEVLELVSGRRELPPWPPFSLSGTSEAGLGISSLENTAAPMQKMDMDVPEEYREHYIRQSKKTKDAVQKWLASQVPEESALPRPATTAPPQDVDDETLTFAMLTYLEPSQRRTLTALLRGMDDIPDLRTPTPAIPTEEKEGKPDILKNTARALYRLYRLPAAPRDPECAMYLLKNPTLHCALATLAAISHGEWEILISGRFDGFLWSGAEDGNGTSPSKANTSKGLLSRSATPLNPSQQSPITPTRPYSTQPQNSQGDRTPGPVQLDEDTEIAVLAEVEREIYLGMEALEDAFEALHTQAESMRRQLRERGAGLSLRVARTRRGDESAGTRTGTPAPHGEAWDRLRTVGAGMGEEDKADVQSIFGGGLLDGRSELAPDDSASNVGWREREKRSRYKKRRPGGGDKGAKERRHERRTPAPVEEVEEEEEEDTTRRAKSSGSERKHRHR